MKQIIEKLKEQTDDNFVLLTPDEARQIVEALEGKGCTTDELKKAFIAGSKFGAERFGSTAGWLGAQLENPDFDEWIAKVKTTTEPELDEIKRKQEKMLKDLSAKELEDDVNRNKI